MADDGPRPGGRIARRRLWLALAHGARGVAVIATFTGALVLGVTLHANAPASRRLAATIGDAATAGLFQGKIAIREVESLTLGATSRVRVRAADVVDPAGHVVIVAKGIDASIDLKRLLLSLATTGAPEVLLEDVVIEDAEVILDVDASGRPTIARAFAAREAPGAGAVQATAPRRVEPRLQIGRARLTRGHVHGDLTRPRLDGDVRDLTASLTLERGRVELELERGHAELRSPKLPGQTAPIVADAAGHLGIDLATTRLTGHVALTGSCGELPLVARASVDGERIDAALDVARVEPSAVGSAFAGVPLAAPLELRARARGVLPTIAVDARLQVGESVADVKGEVDLREGDAFTLDVDAAHVDARAFGADVATDITAKVTGEGTLSGAAGPLGTFRVTTTEGTAASQRVPAATVEGRFESTRVTAVVRVRDPGVDAHGKITFDLRSSVAELDLQARSDSLRAIARLPRSWRGAGSARAQGKVDFARETIDAMTTASVDDVRVDAFFARHLTASGTISGALARPILDVGFAGVGLGVRPAHGAPLVYRRATGHAQITLAPSPHVRGATLSVTPSGPGDDVHASARDIRLSGGLVDARGVRVTGLGAPLELDVGAGDGPWRLRAKTAGLDLRRVAQLTGLEELELLPEGTRAVVDVDLQQRRRGADGHVDVVVQRDGVATGARALVAAVHATMTDGRLIGSGKITAEGLGQLEVTRADLEVPGRLDATSLKRSTGLLELRGAIDLKESAPLLGGGRVEDVSGTASFEALVERFDPGALPAVRATVRTEGLGVTLASAQPTGPLVVSGVDVLAHAAWDGRTDDAELSVVSWDERGLLGSAGAKAKLPLAAWAAGAAPLDADALGALDVSAIADLPRRDVSKLPRFVGAPELRGEIDGRVELEGALARPRVTVSGSAHNLRPGRRRAPRQTSFSPLDGTLEARWDGERAAVTFALDERERERERQRTRTTEAREAREAREPGRVRGLVLFTDVRMTDLLRGTSPAALPWVASAEIEVEGLSLAGVPGVERASGSVTGRVRLRDLNREPSFEAKARVDDLDVGGAQVQSLDVTAGGRDRSLFAHATILDERGDEKSRGTFQLASRSLRMTGVSVSWDPTAPTRLDYAVQNGRLALIGPFVRGAVSEIDGRVDGAGSITVDEASQVFEGGLALQDGRLYVNLLGEEITSLKGTVRFDRDGKFRIDEAAGKMGTGEFRASANGRMKGLLFMGAEATIVALNDGVPISSEGATFAEATGEVKLSATMSEDRSTVLVDADAPRANAELPDRDVQELQPLDPDPTVLVGVRRSNGALDTTAVRKSRGGTGRQASMTTSDGSALGVRLDVTLGDSVHLEGRGIDVAIRGRTIIELADELKVTGRIDLRDGTIEVHGRRFTVDRGTVTFPEGGDPSNPTIVAAAYWDSPDRTRVWVELTGPLKGGTVALRSEPPYSPNEILSVLLFGRPDPNMAAAGASGAKSDSGATAVGTGFIAADINRALSEIDENLDVETDTLSGNRTRTKLGRSFFDRRLKVQIGYAPGRTTYREPDTTYVFVNWHFVPKWSLVATRGNLGTSILDVLFQHRY